MWSSQVAIGNSNGLRLRVAGERGSLTWWQEQLNELLFTPLGGAPTQIRRGREDLSAGARVRTRTPPGHPEGYIEAFASLYAGFAEAIRARREARAPRAIGLDLPTSRGWFEGGCFRGCRRRQP